MTTSLAQAPDDELVRRCQAGEEGAFEVLVRARALEAQGRDVVHMEIGEPDFPTAPHVVEAGKKALDEGQSVMVLLSASAMPNFIQDPMVEVLKKCGACTF